MAQLHIELHSSRRWYFPALIRLNHAILWVAAPFLNDDQTDALIESLAHATVVLGIKVELR
jgi:hypothetical protein